MGCDCINYGDSILINNLTYSAARAFILVVVLLAAERFSAQAQQVSLPPAHVGGLGPASLIERSTPLATRLPTFTRRFANGSLARMERESTSAIIVAHSTNGTNVASSGSRSTYIWGGALIGAVITAASIAIYMNQSNKEVLVNPLTLAPVVAGGAVVGAFLGWELSH